MSGARLLMPFAGLLAVLAAFLPQGQQSHAAGNVSACDEASVLAAIAGGGR